MCLLIHFILQLLGPTGTLQDLVLAVRQPVFDKVFTETKGDNK